jgi:BCD family chlorophyll transporter-like MFS transporter
MLVTSFAVRNIEGSGTAVAEEIASTESAVSFREALREVWREQHTRRFAVFVFVSMIACSAQDLILEPFAGVSFGFSPGETTKLSGIQNGGVLCGMVFLALAGSAVGGRRFGSMKAWTVAGCIASAFALAGLACAGVVGPAWPLRTSVFILGFTNGVYAVAAIGSMMALVSQGARSREGVRMGLWGAAQAIAFGSGGILGTAASDIARLVLASPGLAYASVFAAEALLFLVAAGLALSAGKVTHPKSEPSAPLSGSLRMANMKAE